MSYTRPHADRLGTSGATDKVLTWTSTGVAEYRTPAAGSGGAPTDLITGNDSTFAASLGSWVASGGTLTRDTAVKLPGFTASLKHVTTATNQYVELPIAGTFEAGQQYWCVLLVETASGAVAPTVTFGLIGTDSAARQIDLGNTDFQAIGVPWTPSANRTGVKVRFLMPSTTTTYYIGWAKAFLSLTTPILNNDVAGTHSRLYVPLGTTDAVFLGAHTGVYSGGLGFFAGGETQIASSDTSSGFVAQVAVGAYTWAEHTPADLAAEGWNLEVGADYVGLYISEKDSATIQVYDDAAGAYNIELVDQGSFGFKTVNATNSTPFANLHWLKNGTADPSAGAGVASAIGSLYGRNNGGAGELWFKTGAAATAWTKITVP